MSTTNRKSTTSGKSTSQPHTNLYAFQFVTSLLPYWANTLQMSSRIYLCMKPPRKTTNTNYKLTTPNLQEYPEEVKTLLKDTD